jgi:hypothetical protein
MALIRVESVVQPWEANPYCLIDWWVMEKFAAEKFCKICSRLGGLCQLYNELSTVPHGQIEGLQQSLRNIAKDCLAIGLEIIPLQIETAIKRLEASSANPLHELEAKQVSQMLYDLGTLLTNEMATRLFLWVPSDRAAFYGKEDLFGEEVKAQFPSTSFDIKEGGNSYAAARNTACVFHLMRVLEIGLAVLAKEFSISADHTNWHNIIEQIEAKVRGMASDPNRKPIWKEDQEFYAQAASHFMFLKDAWRNYTAHARGKYTQEEAQAIMMNVRSFMQKLATKLKEA